MANGKTRFRVLRNSVPPEPEERFPRSTKSMAGARLRPAVLEWLRQGRWDNPERAGCSRVKARLQTKMPSCCFCKLTSTAECRKQENDDVSGDELLAFGAVVNGGLRPDSEFTFDSGVGVDDELKFVGILVVMK